MFDAAIEETVRTCRWCAAERPLDDFVKSKKSKNGRLHRCKPCRAEQNSVWAKANRRERRAALPKEKVCTACGDTKPSSSFHKSKRDGLKSKCRECRATETRDYGREKARKRYHANRTLRLRQMKEYRELNQDQAKEYQKAWSRTVNGKARKLVAAARARSISKSIPFDLDWEWAAKRLIIGKCEATGIELYSTGMIGDTPWAPSIDRIIPKLGYVKENCRVVCYIMNTAKNGFTDNDVETFCTEFLVARGCRVEK